MGARTPLANIEIRRGTADDAAELAEFAGRTFRETYSADTNQHDLQAHISANFSCKKQSTELADPNVITILVRSDGMLIAYAQVRRSRPPPCVTHASPIELHRLYLDRRAHGTELALMVMQEIQQAAREFGGRHIWLSVWERNARAIAFYKKAKFVDIGSQFYMVGADKQLDRVLVVGVDPESADAV